MLDVKNVHLVQYAKTESGMEITTSVINSIIKTLKFMHCPLDYCCEMEECKSYDSCSPNRTGILCGKCEKGYQDNYFTTDCVETSKCQSVVLFWFLLLLSSLGVTLGFAFTKEIVAIGNYIKEFVSKVVAAIFKKSEEEENSEKKIVLSTAFNITVGFYQAKKLIAIKLSKRYDTDGIDYPRIHIGCSQSGNLCKSIQHLMSDDWPKCNFKGFHQKFFGTFSDTMLPTPRDDSSRSVYRLR